MVRLGLVNKGAEEGVLMRSGVEGNLQFFK